MSNHNLSTRWSRHSFDSASCFATSHNLGDVLEKLRDTRTEHVSASRHRPGVSVLLHAVLQGGLSRLYHVPLGYLMFIRLAQSFTVCIMEGCVVQWKGQMLLLFLPLRALSTSLRWTSGIHDGDSERVMVWTVYEMASFGRELGIRRPFLGCQLESLVSAYFGKCYARQTRVESAFFIPGDLYRNVLFHYHRRGRRHMLTLYAVIVLSGGTTIFSQGLWSIWRMN